MKITARKAKKFRPFSRLASHAYSDRQIAKNTQEKTHNGDSMEYVFKKILSDPNVELGEPDNRGIQRILFKGTDIGWIDPKRYIGYIDDKAYDNLEPYVEPADPIEDDIGGVSEDDIINAADDITITDETTEPTVADEIEDTLTEELCVDIVNLGFSENGDFATDIFLSADDKEDAFFDNLIDEDPKDVALKFFNGEDLDSKGPANPTRSYFRFNDKENIESTDDPGAIYYATILDKIVDFILDHADEYEFPEEIQEILDKYIVEE